MVLILILPGQFVRLFGANRHFRLFVVGISRNGRRGTGEDSQTAKQMRGVTLDFLLGLGSNLAALVEEH